MSRSLQDARRRLFFDEMSTRMLRALAHASECNAAPNADREDVIDALVEVPDLVLSDALANAVTAPDLRGLCKRFGYSAAGTTHALVTRLVGTLDDPDARVVPRWRPYDEARAFARGLELRSQAEWWRLTKGKLENYGQLPKDIPVAPHQVYADRGWTNWGDFLGTENQAKHLIVYRPFALARAYVHALGLANATEWKAYCRKRIGNRRLLPPDIPAAPNVVYADQGWISFGDWLGNEHVHASKITYRSYETARAFVREVGIRGEDEWRAYCRGEVHQHTPRPLDVPSNPHRTYRGKGWMRTKCGSCSGTRDQPAWMDPFVCYLCAGKRRASRAASSSSMSSQLAS